MKIVVQENVISLHEGVFGYRFIDDGIPDCLVDGMRVVNCSERIVFTAKFIRCETRYYCIGKTRPDGQDPV